MANKVIATPYDAITYKIIGCAMAIHRDLGPGLQEASYQMALKNSLSDSALTFEAQRFFPVYDDPDQQRLIGYYVPDFVVEESVIVEIKALRGLDNSHLAQVIAYLAISGCAIGLLINFGERSLRHRRILPPKKVIENLVNRQWLFVPDWLTTDF